MNEQKMNVNDEAINLLQSLVSKKIAILGICGPYRSGKSYFLSQVIGGKDFEVSHGAATCTRGIWMSTSVLECEELCILVLDTEGAGAAELSEKGSEGEVMKYLIITTLLCSYLIYNSIKISIDHLDKMRQVQL